MQDKKTSCDAHPEEGDEEHQPAESFADASQELQVAGGDSEDGQRGLPEQKPSHVRISA
jgi:hypothetical protein